MNGLPDPSRLAAWHAGSMGEEELAKALGCEVDAMRLVLAGSGVRGAIISKR